VTERSQLAMPETTIGLIPDVGGTWLLSRAQGRLGVYLGLTGTRMSGSDAIQAGFADTYLSASQLPTLIHRLSAATDDPIEEVLEQMAEPVPVSPLATNRPLIDRVFAGRTMPEIHAGLLTTTDPLATKARADLATRSPKALALTLAAIQQAKSLTRLEQALTVEFRLCARLYEDGEFIEGVRALIVDKDKAPKWQPPSGSTLTPDQIAAFFAPLGSDWPL
jgi:enoyl-CoA hydratase